MRWMALLLVASLTLAGCSDGKDGDSPDDPTGPDSRDGTEDTGPEYGTPTGPAGGEGPGRTPTPNRAPTPTVETSVRTGDPPLYVNFTLDGSDRDGDPLNWTLDFDDGNFTGGPGESLPMVVGHNFTTGRDYNVTFTLSDGELSTNVTVVVSLTPPPDVEPELVVVTGSTSQSGNPATSGGVGASGCAGFTLGESGLDCVFGEVPAEVIGKGYEFTATSGNPDFEFWDSCDPVLGVPTQSNGGAATGTVPAETGCVIMWEYGVSTGTFTMAMGH